MSTQVGNYPVIIWTPETVEVFNPSTKKWRQLKKLDEVRGDIGNKAVVTLGRRVSFVRTTRLPDAPKPDVVRILSLQVDQLFPTPAGETAVDFMFTDHKNGEGRLSVVAATKSETLRDLHNELKSAGIQAVAVLPIALASALLAEAEGHSTAAVIELNPEGLSIDLIDKGVLMSSRVVPPPKDSYAIMAEVGRTRAAARIEPGEVIAAGGLALPEATISVEARAAEFLSTQLPPLSLELPEVLLKRAKQKIDSRRRVAISIWMAAAAIVGFTYLNYYEASTEVKKGEQRWANIMKRTVDTKQQAEGRVKKLGEIDKVLERAFEPKQTLGDVAVVVNTLMPKGVWLNGLTIERGKLATFRGIGTNSEAVGTLVKNLTAQKRFRDVRLAFVNNALIDQTPVVNYSISAHVVGNYPITVSTKKK